MIGAAICKQALIIAFIGEWRWGASARALNAGLVVLEIVLELILEIVLELTLELILELILELSS